MTKSRGRGPKAPAGAGPVHPSTVDVGPVAAVRTDDGGGQGTGSGPGPKIVRGAPGPETVKDPVLGIGNEGTTVTVPSGTLRSNRGIMTRKKQDLKIKNTKSLPLHRHSPLRPPPLLKRSMQMK